MLREIRRVRQNRGEPRRRWFTSGTMDLVVWENDAGEPIGFQFCYDKGSQEHAFGWSPAHGYLHMAVDDGEGGGALRYKATPMLLALKRVDNEGIAALFTDNSNTLPQDIAAFVIRKIAEYSTMKSNE